MLNTEQERQAFGVMLGTVYALYGRELSGEMIGMWWGALKEYDLQTIRQALHRHVKNPDSGQFLPKPADVVRMSDGSTVDSALLAWSAFDQALQRVGPYQSVTFDDPLIHRVVEDMGGWTILARSTLKDWPFRQNEFVNRYRGYKARGELPAYPPRLIGISEGENLANGFFRDEAGQQKLIAETVLLGDPAKAKEVMAAGSSVPRLAVSSMRELLPKAVGLLESKT